jgi:hypothetical protein
VALPAPPGGAGPGCALPPGARSGALPHNPVYTSRRAHLTGRGHNKLNDGKARSALAAALLRQLLAVITQQVPWDPVIASGPRCPGR